MSKLKTLKDIEFKIWTNEETNVFQNNEIKKKLKAEAINRVNNCCPNDNIGGTPLRKNKRCEACKRDIWFNNLTMEDLK